MNVIMAFQIAKDNTAWRNLIPVTKFFVLYWHILLKTSARYAGGLGGGSIKGREAIYTPAWRAIVQVQLVTSKLDQAHGKAREIEAIVIASIAFDNRYCHALTLNK